ncbi:L-aspartate oxidase [Jeotgalibacillus campisalis]|uniref:L-aspartate oxidase n=1 Tax=Jeotgalibacillus campisalis TaxID=220754 RepID=A0A0C2VRB4_9BACL|nr:L-aspartate oxidase [Jeotgalibacillus campisalis]KIL46986.1 L-aspartate oxidase [Jeotgalibacillus campisalis]
MKFYDVVIIGSGISALAAARKAAPFKSVAIVSKYGFSVSNSMLAQGGVAAVFSEEDHVKEHLLDTLTAGDGHSDRMAAEFLVNKGPEVIKQIIEDGMRFDCDDSSYVQLGQEGAHSHRRILHAGGDATGRRLTAFMVQQIQSNVEWIEHHSVIELIVKDGKCSGVKLINSKGMTEIIWADHIVLSTGGCGNLFESTSNAATANGEGLSLAYYAGAELTDLEFIQFHPTALATDHPSSVLISEAVRGEGARLVTEEGEEIMKDLHPLQDLAPRDIVAREVYKRIQQGEKIYLAINYVKEFTKKFPTITDLCKREGIDLKEGRIPVRPAAHFHMGGIKVQRSGQTSFPRLYAIGEAACTGAHGANRLASNSLLEGLVYGEAAGEFLQKQSIDRTIVSDPYNRTAGTRRSPSAMTLQDLKKLMMKYAGIERTAQGMKSCLNKLEKEFPVLTEKNIYDYHPEDLTFLHQVTAAYLIVRSAYERQESRGAHYCLDYPVKKEEWQGVRIIQKMDESHQRGNKKHEQDEGKENGRAVFI